MLEVGHSLKERRLKEGEEKVGSRHFDSLSMASQVPILAIIGNKSLLNWGVVGSLQEYNVPGREMIIELTSCLSNYLITPRNLDRVLRQLDSKSLRLIKYAQQEIES